VSGKVRERVGPVLPAGPLQDDPLHLLERGGTGSLHEVQ
jgi:hypothetical protein